MYYVYVLKTASSTKRFYVGYTSDLKRRLIAHNAGENTSTAYGVPWSLVYYEAYQTKELAIKREAVLKQRGNALQSLIKRIGSS